jgi:pimeloyl-ACP methyl ester carboxylesterase
MKLRSLFLCFALLVGILPVSAQEGGAFTNAPCPFEMPAGEIEGETIVCGIVTVPESHSGLSDGVIELAVIVLYATGEETLDPVLYLAGGPGNSGTLAMEDYLDDPIRQNTSLIFFDQRGTGYSRPSLDCAEDDDIEDCYDSLVSSGIELDAYRSSENAADVNDLITALDLEGVNLYGISYGTRLALTVMKNPHPAIRSVILDGVYPPDVHAYEEDESNILRVFSLIGEGCAQDSACNAAFPDLEGTFYAAVQTLNEDPLSFEDQDGETSDLTGDAFIDQLFLLLYDTDAIPYVPALVYAAANRDVEALEFFYYSDDVSDPNDPPPLVWDETLENDGDSQGMFTSVDCADEAPFNSESAIEETIAGLDVDPLWAEAMLQDTLDGLSVCDVWQVTPSEAGIRTATVSDIPTLILNGEYDPVTPPAWGEKAAETLSNSYVFTMPAGGHGVIDMTDCPQSIAQQFLNDPYTTPDGSCVEDMPPPQWYVDYP